MHRNARSEDEARSSERGQRIDLWLWHARFARTRTTAAQLVLNGHVRVNARRLTVCAKRVKEGDVLTLSLDRSVRVIRVKGLAQRRGSAPDAQGLYEDAGTPADTKANATVSHLAPQDQTD